MTRVPCGGRVFADAVELLWNSVDLCAEDDFILSGGADSAALLIQSLATICEEGYRDRFKEIRNDLLAVSSTLLLPCCLICVREREKDREHTHRW